MNQPPHTLPEAKEATMSADSIIRIARKHLGSGQMESSARLCLSDALALHEIGDLGASRMCALKSLAYSVGTLHPDYQAAAARVEYNGYITGNAFVPSAR